MSTRRAFIMTLIALLILPASLLRAQDSKADELKKRFQERAAEVQQLKSKGAVGETDEGYLDWVARKDSKATEIVNSENSDRKELYALLAKQTKETPEVVAKHAAQRNFDHAKQGEYLRVDGKWHQKAD